MHTTLVKKYLNLYGPLAIPIILFLLMQCLPLYYVSQPEYDEAIYLNVMRHIQEGGIPWRNLYVYNDLWLYADHTPLYQYFLFLFSLLVDTNLLLLRLFTLFTAIACLTTVYHLVLIYRGQIAALIATLLLSVQPFFGLFAFYIREEIFFCFFVLLAVAFLIKEEETEQNHYLYIASLLLVVAILVKELSLIFSFTVALYVFWYGRGWIDKLRRAFIIGFPSVAILMVWAWIVYLIQPLRFQVLYARRVSALTGLAASDFRSSISQIDWLRVFVYDFVGFGLLITFVMVLIWALRTKTAWPRIVNLLLLYIGIGTFYTFAVSLKEARHVIPMLPIICTAAGLLLDWSTIGEELKRLRPAKQVLVGWVVVSLLWALSPYELPLGEDKDYSYFPSWVTPSYHMRIFINDQHYAIFEEVGAYLATHTDPNEVIGVFHEGPVVGYHARRPYQAIYTGDYQIVMNKLKRTTYLVSDNVVFTALNEEEKAQVLNYIDENFTLEIMIEDEYRQIPIYKRR